MKKVMDKIKSIFTGKRTFIVACALSAIVISGSLITYAATSNGYDPSRAKTDGGWTSTTTGIHYNSYGTINYTKGSDSVVVDAADIAAIDEMVGNGKKNIKNAIKSVDADGRLGTSSWDESTYPDFESMANMIVASQSLSEAQTGTQAVNNKGEALYYKDQTASDTKDLTQTCTDNTGFPVYYQPATAANLTAGSAAFIDGQLILGTGADNDTYLENANMVIVKHLGTITFTTDVYGKAYVDINKLDNDYSSYKLSDFIISLPNKINATTYGSSGGYSSDSFSLNYSYDATIGRLWITYNFSGSRTYTNCGITANLYVKCK